ETLSTHGAMILIAKLAVQGFEVIGESSTSLYVNPMYRVGFCEFLANTVSIDLKDVLHEFSFYVNLSQRVHGFPSSDTGEMEWVVKSNAQRIAGETADEFAARRRAGEQRIEDLDGYISSSYVE